MTRELVDDVLRAFGPDVGVPTLRALVPWAARSALQRHLHLYRLAHRRRRRARLHQLFWRRPGAVWAADLAEAPGGRPILAVRDLASRCTLAWTALASGTAGEVGRALRELFRRHGAPLVLKSDSGSCFVAARVRGLLSRFGVAHLRSPRSWPAYNGACEAGIGVLRALTETAAAGRRRWTLEDLEDARARSNELVRRRGGASFRAAAEWERRRRIGVRERKRFRVALLRRMAQLRREDPPCHARARERLRRKSIERTLRGLRYLRITSRWVRARRTRSRSSYR